MFNLSDGDGITFVKSIKAALFFRGADVANALLNEL
jgi:hypothetical protein